jgi:hypothetical protein
MPVLIGVVKTCLLAVLTGWLARYGIWDRKPLDILRQIES